MEVQKKVEKVVVPTNVEELLASGEIVQLKQVDGSAECKIIIQNDKPWRPKEKLHVLNFILPQGYKKCVFSLETQRREGDVVEASWASCHPDDARIFLHAKTSRCLKANDGILARVHSVYGIRKW